MRKEPQIIVAASPTGDAYRDDNAEALKPLLPYVSGVKVGIGTLFAPDPTAKRFVSAAAYRYGLKVLLDAKLDDIGNTTAKALMLLLDEYRGTSMITVHGSMSEASLRFVVEICGERGVTPVAIGLLSDVSEKECIALHGASPNIYMRRIMERAWECGLRNLVTSVRELKFLRRSEIGKQMTMIAVAVQPSWFPANDQVRTGTPVEAAQDGADYVVVGRPIMWPPSEIGGRVEAAQRIKAEISDACSIAISA